MISRSSFHLSCPDFLWESEFFRKFPIYTNRLGWSQWIEKFVKSGFDVLDVKLYDDFAQSLDISYNGRPDEGNLISNMHIIVRKTC